MQEHSEASDDPSVVTNRSMEILVALLFLVAAAIVMYGSLQIGAGWREDGPAPGFFPFYVALVMAMASAINLIAAVRIPAADNESFVGRGALGRVLAVLAPSTLYVLAIGGVGLGPINIPGLGIYVSSFFFICGFMLTLGREPLWKAALVGLAVPLVAFVLFERWFKVALPKGPLEALLGLS